MLFQVTKNGGGSVSERQIVKILGVTLYWGRKMTECFYETQIFPVSADVGE